MDTTLIVATGHGIFTYERHEHEWRARAGGLDGQHVTSAIAREGVILAGTTNGVFRSDDYGKKWQAGSSGLHTRHVRWMAFHPDLSDDEFVGTEPAAIFVSHNGAACYIDLINDTPPTQLISVRRQWGVHILGWTADTSDRVAAGELYVELASSAGLHYWAKAHRYERPDVAKAFGNPALSGSGFTLSAVLQSLAPGVYRVKLVLLNGSHARECDPMRQLDIQ